MLNMDNKLKFFFSNGLDTDCKKWRFFADILNDAAMFLELLVPYISSVSLQILCITTSMKAVVSVNRRIM